MPESKQKPLKAKIISIEKKGKEFIHHALVYKKSKGAFSGQKGRLISTTAMPIAQVIEVDTEHLEGEDYLRLKTSEKFKHMENIQKQTREFLYKLPKTEIHMHVEAVIRREDILKIGKRDKNEELNTKAKVDATFEYDNLPDFIQSFIKVQNSIATVDDLNYMLDGLFVYIQEHNLIYTEIFFAISAFIKKGFDYKEMIQLFEKRIEQFERDKNSKVRIIIDVGRTFGAESAAQNLEHILSYKSKYIVGIGLGGNEKAGPAKEFKQVFKKARSHGYHCVAHAGEDVGPESVWDAVRVLGAERIGHGIAAIEDPKLMDYLRDKKIPLEICLTSNVFTGKYTRSVSEHPVQQFFPHGMICTINSDDPVFFKTSVTEEMIYFHEKLNFSLRDIITMTRQGIEATFSENKEDLLQNFDKQLKKLLKEYPLVLLEEDAPEL